MERYVTLLSIDIYQVASLIGKNRPKRKFRPLFLPSPRGLYQPRYLFFLYHAVNLRCLFPPRTVEQTSFFSPPDSSLVILNTTVYHVTHPACLPPLKCRLTTFFFPCFLPWFFPRIIFPTPSFSSSKPIIAFPISSFLSIVSFPLVHPLQYSISLCFARAGEEIDSNGLKLTLGTRCGT